MRALPKASEFERPFDLVIAGGGRLGIQTLSSLTKALEGSTHSRARILMVHDGCEFGGAAYGQKASPIPLPFHQDVAGADRSDEFQSWIRRHITRVFQYIETFGGSAGQQWLTANRQAFAQHKFGERRLPRAIYGLYLTEKLRASLDNRPDFEIHLTQGRLMHPRHAASGRYHLRVKDGSIKPLSFSMTDRDGFLVSHMQEHDAVHVGSIIADRVVWCPGLMPNPQHPFLKGHSHYFDTLYRPQRNIASVQDAVNRLYEDQHKPVDIVIGGAGPAAMDIFTWIHYHADLADKVKISLIAGKIKTRNAALESDKGIAGEIFKPHFIANIFAKAAHVIEALADDVQRALCEGFSQAEAVKQIYPLMMRATMQLPHEERYDFFLSHFDKLRDNFFIYETKEAIDTYTKMKAAERVHSIEGKIIHEKVRPAGEKISVCFTQQGQNRSIEADIFLNCMGGIGQQIANNNNIDPDISPLPHLLENGLGRINLSGKGFDVDDHFQLVGACGTIRNGFYTASFLTTGAVINGLPTNGGNPDGAAAIIARHAASRLKTSL